MTYSMTAYANRDVQIPGGIAKWEIRSVNHRYLDLSFKLPEIVPDLEYTLREFVRQNLSRGKIDCVLKLDLMEKNKQELIVDYPLVDQLFAVGRKMLERFPNGVSVSLFDVLRWPSVIKTSENALENLVEPLQQSFRIVLQDFMEARAREGLKLQACIKERWLKMLEHVQNIKERLSEVQKAFRAKFHEKFNELSTVIDPNRFEQEMIYFMQKMDISEEIDRLESHLTEMDRIFEKAGVMGRRLDFLMQELNRETNTIASKAIDKATIQDAIDLKVLIEEMREQIQNLE